MRYIEFNKGWKIFGVMVLILIIAIGLFFGGVGIYSAIMKIDYVSALKIVFNIQQNVVESQFCMIPKLF